MPDLPNPPSHDDRAPSDIEVPETRTPSFALMGHVLLPDTPGADAGSPIRPSSPEMPADRLGRYQLFGEIGDGGMGVVLRGRDPKLGRELAVKVLLSRHKDHPDLVRRFVEEAQIAGQLQHPGIAPVYDVGTFPDGRPYFAMKLVKGRTLAALLKERAGPPADLDKFLVIFEAMAQTMAYAHARRVIHRDLKPSNVMVGGFGEVQVMDWGLAKVLAEGGAVDDRAVEAATDKTVIATARGGSDVETSKVGSALGTPAYMAPEQAAGEVARVDRRSDVFGLGAILCEILTGRPPYRGRDKDEILDRAIRCDIADARARLEVEQIDPELSALALDCMAPEPAARPGHAGEVADRMTAYFAGVRERLRAADLERARAEARAVEERKRRKLRFGLAASILGLAALGGGVRARDQQQRADHALRTTVAVDGILVEAARLRDDARAAPDHPERWAEILAVAGQAEALVQQARADAPLRARVASLARAFRGERAQAVERAKRDEAERKLLSDLVSTREGRADHWEPKRTDADYAAAFRKAGLDLDADPGAAGPWIAGHARPLEIASFLDDWANVRNSLGSEEASLRRIVDAARAADPDPWRDSLRRKISASGIQDIEEFRRLADDVKALDVQPANSLVLLALWLRRNAGDPERAERVLKQAWRQDPGNFWVNFELATVSGRAGKTTGEYARPMEAIRYLSVAIAARPGSAIAYNNLGVALHSLDRNEEAEASHRQAIRLRPGLAGAHHNLGNDLRSQGRLAEAEASHRQAIELRPDDAFAHNGLGVALAAQRRSADAETSFRKAIELRPGYAEAHINLGKTSLSQNRPADAETSFRKATQLRPDDAEAHYSLGVILKSLGNYDEALSELQRARVLSLANVAPGDELNRFLRALDRLSLEVNRVKLLGPRMVAILQGKDRPVDAAEGAAVAQVCYDKGSHAVAVRLWAEAMSAEPKLADDRQAGHRYNAACSAALAGCGKSKDDLPPDDAARVKLRSQALDWLKVELAAWAGVVERGTPDERAGATETLRDWREDSDLAGVRDAGALARLSEGEREGWKAFWAEVEALIAKAEAGRP